MISETALCPLKGLTNAQVFIVGFTLAGMLAFSPADFDVDLGTSLSLFANDIAHSGTSPNIW